MEVYGSEFSSRNIGQVISYSWAPLEFALRAVELHQQMCGGALLERCSFPSTLIMVYDYKQSVETF